MFSFLKKSSSDAKPEIAADAAPAEAAKPAEPVKTPTARKAESELARGISAYENGDYKSAAFDALIDQAARQTTLDGAIGYYHKAEELLFEDLPVIPLWYTNVTAAAGKQVGSLSFNYMGLPDYYKLTVKG